PTGTPARDRAGDSRRLGIQAKSPPSPALSDASTADGRDDDDTASSPPLPPLPAPRLPQRAQDFLRSPTATDFDDTQFETASWGSPYPRTDRNLRRHSSSSDDSSADEDESPIHHLEIDTPFLRPAPDVVASDEVQSNLDYTPSISGAAAVLANRVRRQTVGLTEDWIRTHTTGDPNVEPRHWFSDGSSSEHSSLSGSDFGWFEDRDPSTPKTAKGLKSFERNKVQHPSGTSSVETLETLRPSPRFRNPAASMTTSETEPLANGLSEETANQSGAASRPITPPPKDTLAPAAVVEPPATPLRRVDKPLPKEPAMTPRLKKRVPWKGKNILVLLPRDEERGLPGKPPRPLRQHEIQKMFDSWEELGYNIDGFDHVVEGYQIPGTDDSQSRETWPTGEDVVQERSEKAYQVTLPDLNAWERYVNELQEAKLRALGVFTVEEAPPALPSPTATDPSRQPSAQYPPNPFSPPLPTSSASSGHGAFGYPYNQQFNVSASQSSIALAGASPVPFGPDKFNPRNSSSFPASASPFQFPPHTAQWLAMQGISTADSPYANLNGILSPQSPFGFESASSPAFDKHHRQHSLLTHHHNMLDDVTDDEEDDGSRSSSKTPEALKRGSAAHLSHSQEDGEYHLEESFRNQLEHDDYNPQIAQDRSHQRQMSEKMQVPEHFANEPGKPMVLHHPRPHSRGHSLTHNMMNGEDQLQDGIDQGGSMRNFAPLNGIPEANKGDGEAHEIETNPSELGTPNPEFDVSTPFGQHHKNASTTSNPWVSSTSSVPGHVRSGHGSKPSLSKLNVKAAEFKFNPESSFTPSRFSFSGTSFQPSIFQSSIGQSSPDLSVHGGGKDSIHLPAQFPVASFTGGSPQTDSGSGFNPSKSIFSFSASGPKFRPDAPSFTPVQSLNSQPAVGAQPIARESIFGGIRVSSGEEIVKPAKKSKAIPIVRPRSHPSPEPAQDVADGVTEDADGRPLADDSRTKRAKSQVPEGHDDDVALFAERPGDDGTLAVPATQSPAAAEPELVADEVPGEGETALAADTSVSSAATDEQTDTKATTAAPSETSPAEAETSTFAPFEFESRLDAKKFSEAVPTGVEGLGKSGSALFSPAAEPFAPPTAKETSVASTPKPKTSNPKGLGLGSSRFASPPPKPKGLGSSLFASEPSPPPADGDEVRVWDGEVQDEAGYNDHDESLLSLIHPVVDTDMDLPADPDAPRPSVEEPNEGGEQTFEQIDAIMQEIGNDPTLGVRRTTEPSSTSGPVAGAANSPTLKLEPPRLEPSAFHGKANTPVPVPDLEEPTVQYEGEAYHQPRNDDDDVEEEPRSPGSDWENAFPAAEHDKLENRVQFFDGRVNEVVGSLLASRLEPLEQAVFSIQDAITMRVGRPSSSRRDFLSAVSEDRRQSDADDEDDDLPPRRSASPRRDRRMDQIRAAVLEALTAHVRTQPAVVDAAERDAGDAVTEEAVESPLAKGLAEIKELLTNQPKQQPALEGDILKNLIEEAVHSRMPPPAQPDVDLLMKMESMQGKVEDLEHRLFEETEKLEKEMVIRRAAEDTFADLNRQLQAAETRVEVEIINKSVFDQRVTDLEEKLRQQEGMTEQELDTRRRAEDKLSEVQRLLRISSEEETRLREACEEKDQMIKAMEQANAKTAMKMALLEASQTNSTQSQSELTNRANVLEADLRAVRLDNNHWRNEAERADEAARRHSAELSVSQEENKHLHKSLTTLTTQLEENERLRETWRAKYMSLQDDMAKAARAIAEENARRVKKDQAMIARHEVLDARLHAEAKTRERLEIEMERLQMNERTGMRATKECERLEGLIGELRTENHKLHEGMLATQREADDDREAAASEVAKIRRTLQGELDSARLQVNMVREELEEQNGKLRAELNSLKSDMDTVKASVVEELDQKHRSELEELDQKHRSELEELDQKHQGELDDIRAKYEKRQSSAVEVAQKTEQNLLERLSFSASKIEHYQERIALMEEKLEISKQAAAAAAAAAAKSAAVETAASPAIVVQPKAAPAPVAATRSDVHEKISPQALRESIMVLQEQLQAREQRIEELEQAAAEVDQDAPNKISKRDDEISWLRELLAVRHGDLQDIIAALSTDSYDRNRVKDATIRLKANLQMEEQERERAMNGGSAINLPSIAQTIQTATPRVAQTIGAAWGSWRKGSTSSFTGMGSRLSSPAAAAAAAAARNNTTPSKPATSSSRHGKSLSGLMTPPASGVRQNPLVESSPQPTAFGSTGRRYPSHGSSAGNEGQAQGRRSSQNSVTTRAAEKVPAALEPASPQLPESEEPMTPPMMRPAVYDLDAQPAEFDEDGFFEDE
ncbi:DNA repair exonuclease SbcCD ATPase subunit, partial [Geosmithia morbida]